MRKISIVIFFLLIIGPGAHAQEVVDCDDCVHIRVVDCGVGLSCLISMPEDHFMIYDAGNYISSSSDQVCLEAAEIFGDTVDEIDLMVLSHSDCDHVGAVDELFGTDGMYSGILSRVLYTGHYNPAANYGYAVDAIADEVANGCIDLNLSRDDMEFLPGSTWNFGGCSITMICGWPDSPPEFDDDLPDGGGEENNAISIIIRLQYAGNSVLFTGDTVGRLNGDAFNECIAAEEYMCDSANIIPIDSDILVGQHHGADNASSYRFINEVSPDYVVFSAGSAHHHPRETTMGRILKYFKNEGLSAENFYRTDWGDDEGDSEAVYGSGTGDVTGDDSVDIWLFRDGTYLIQWTSNDVDPHVRP